MNLVSQTKLSELESLCSNSEKTDAVLNESIEETKITLRDTTASLYKLKYDFEVNQKRYSAFKSTKNLKSDLEPKVTV